MAGIKFEMGQLTATRGVADRMEKIPLFQKFVFDSLARHACGDWGDLCEEDKQLNDASLTDEMRLMSAYEHENQPKIWIITEADRSSTTVLFPEEY